MAGLVPAISLRDALCPPKRDARVKPAHDNGESGLIRPRTALIRRQSLREVARFGQRVELRDRRLDHVDLRGREHAPGQSAEFGSDGVVRHRIFARAERLAHHGLVARAIAHRDDDAGGTLPRIDGLAFGIDGDADGRGPGGDGAVGTRRFGEICEVDVAMRHRQRGDEREAHLRGRHVLPAGMGMLGRDGVGADVDLLDVVAGDIVLPAQGENAVDGGMQVTAAGMGLEIALRDRERRAELAGLARQLQLAIG